MRGVADTTLQKEVKETQPLVFQPLTSPFDFLTVENEIIVRNLTFCNKNFSEMIRDQSFDLQNAENPRHINGVFLQFLAEKINTRLSLLLDREFNTCCT